MRRSKLTIVLILFAAVTVIAQTKDVISIIPKPVSTEMALGNFNLSSQTKLWIDNGEELEALGNFVSDYIKKSTGIELQATTKMTREVPSSLIQLHIDNNFEHADGYSLKIEPAKILITAKTGTGLFYGIQSFWQLLPIKCVGNCFSLPCLSITDYPRFNWRGMHLDVGRHLFPIEFIKKYIDILSFYKINKFHWHLTEDQGWRIEIKKYPKLTQVGAWRKETMKDGKPYGGFYTQEQIKEVVAYASARYITVVPEIELPGHSQAAIAAYPEYSCTGGPFDVGTVWGVIKDVYCAGNNKTFDFLQDVFDEVLALFPSEYIHIGGDECPKDRWKECPKCQLRIMEEGLKDEHELQSYFIQRIEKYLNNKGRKIIGWDEILEGGLAPNAAVMSWRGIDGGIAAAKAKHFAVMSPGTHCYFDHYQGLTNEPKAIGGYTSLEKIYSYEPIPAALNEEEAKYILGAQANMWTEYMPTSDYVEYMLLPRLLALSEVVWSPSASKDYKDFTSKIEKHYQLLENKGYNFRIPRPLPDEAELLLNKGDKLIMNKPFEKCEVRFTLDGSEPTLQSTLYTQPITLSQPTLVLAKVFMPGGKQSLISSCMVSFIDTTINGLNYKLYEGSWNMIPDFESITPVKTGKVKRLYLRDFKSKTEGYALNIESSINISVAGEYQFYLSSDDGSKLFINNQEIINNDGSHSMKEVSAKITLPAGKHPLKIHYFNKWGTNLLKLDYEGPGITKRMIPAGEFFLN